MVFVINDLKYDTDKMELVSDKIKLQRQSKVFGSDYYIEEDATLYVSKKGRWLTTYEHSYNVYARPISEEEAKDLLKRYDLDKYESVFGELEEA